LREFERGEILMGRGELRRRRMWRLLPAKSLRERRRDGGGDDVPGEKATRDDEEHRTLNLLITARPAAPNERADTARGRLRKSSLDLAGGRRGGSSGAEGLASRRSFADKCDDRRPAL
jgi:hypothetical protein